MKIEQLLEKREQIQLEILKQLILNNGRLSITRLCNHVELARPSFNQYISELNEQAKSLEKNLRVFIEGEELVLEMAADLNLFEIISTFLQDSLKFQLLEFLLVHRKFSIVQLANQFATSESSIFRKIKELNASLKEFDLQIKNGRFQGEELQVRYFYYQLYSFFADRQLPDYLKIATETEGFIRALERVIQTKVTKAGKKKIACWLGITKKRLLAEKTKYSRTKIIYMSFKDDPLYKKAAHLITFYFSRTSVETNQYEPLMFYSFLVSFSVLNEETFYHYDLTRSKKLPPALLDVYIRETMLLHYRPRRLSIEEEKSVGYQLALIDNKLYFYQGKIEFYDRQQLLEQQKKLLSPTLYVLAKELQHIGLRQLGEVYAPENTLHDYLLINYMSILAMIDFYIAKTVSVGIDLRSLPVYRIPFQQFLLTELQGISGVHVEIYQEERSYDLIIRAANSAEETDEKMYYLSEFETEYDVRELRKIIEKMKKEKN